MTGPTLFGWVRVRRQALNTGTAGLKRTRLRATPSKRDWTAALAKVETEGCCRVCGRSGVKLDAAHVIPRSHVGPGVGEDPRNLVPLCAPEGCHAAYDSHALDLLPSLTRDEEVYIVGLVGLARAYRFTTHTRYKGAPETPLVNESEAA